MYRANLTSSRDWTAARSRMGNCIHLCLFGPPISGALISNYGGGAKGYEMAGMFSGVVVLAGTVFTVGSRFCLNKEVFAVM